MVKGVLWSPPSRGRGLKHLHQGGVPDVEESPPSRGRGLKLLCIQRYIRRSQVAPFAGAWIETMTIGLSLLPK